MYFCYVDESGDCGAFDPSKPEKTGSPYFALSGLIVEANNWKFSLDVLKAYRKKLAANSYLPYDVEFHCAEMIDPRKIKEYTQIKVSDRWKLIEEFAEIIGKNFVTVSVIINKSSSRLLPEEYLTTGITKIYQAFDLFLKENKQHGIVFLDRANEKAINTHVRKLMSTGSSGNTIPGIRINAVIEDPIFRISSDSIFIQAADVIVYTLKEKEFPQAARKKFQADRIFDRKLLQTAYRSTLSDDDGIIRP